MFNSITIINLINFFLFRRYFKRENVLFSRGSKTTIKNFGRGLNNSLKELVIQIIIALNVIITCLADLVTKNFFKTKLNGDSVLLELINQGIIIVIFMLLGALLLEKLIKKINILPKEPRDSYLKLREYVDFMNNFKAEISKLYVYTICLIIFGLLINRRINYMITWILVLSGNKIWFGTLAFNKRIGNNVKNRTKVKEFSLFRDKINILLITLALVLPAMLILIDNKILTEIGIGIVLGFILNGLIYLMVAIYLLNKNKIYN